MFWGVLYQVRGRKKETDSIKRTGDKFTVCRACLHNLRRPPYSFSRKSHSEVCRETKFRIRNHQNNLFKLQYIRIYRATGKGSLQFCDYSQSVMAVSPVYILFRLLQTSTLLLQHLRFCDICKWCKFICWICGETDFEYGIFKTSII